MHHDIISVIMQIPTTRTIVPNRLPDICRAIACFELGIGPREIVPPTPELFHIYLALLLIGRDDNDKDVMYNGADIQDVLCDDNHTPFEFFDKFDHTAACPWAGYDTRILKSLFIHPSPIKMAVLAHNLLHMWRTYNNSTFSFSHSFFATHASAIIDCIQTHVLPTAPHYYHAINNLVVGLDGDIRRFTSIDTTTYNPSAQMMIDRHHHDPDERWHMRAHQAWLERAPGTQFAYRNIHLAAYLLGMQRLIDMGVIVYPHLSMLEDMLNDNMTHADLVKTRDL